MSGRVKSADGGNLVIATKDGDVTLELAADALVRKVNDGQRDGVTVGGMVAVMLPADYQAGDPQVARAVVAMPARPRPGRAQ